MSEIAQLDRLNREYVRASLAGDVGWYREHLADDFVCIESDGSVLDKEAFLEMTARGSDLASYHLEAVDIRILGETALVRATGRWLAHDGTPGLSHYTDVYVRSPAGWRAVSAQITRPGGS